MGAGATQIRQARPATQGAVRATMSARPITGQQPTAAQRVAGNALSQSVDEHAIDIVLGVTRVSRMN